MRDEKYLNVDLNDPRSAAIAEVMTNKTCKKILDLISERQMSESDIASELGIPLNTVGYNIKKLLDAELIEKTKNFFWSVKGKKISTYKLSNKKIIISPRRLVSVAPLALIAAVLGAILIIALLGSQDRIENLNTDNNMKQFSSYQELEKFVKEREEAARNIGGYYGADETFTSGIGTAKASASSVSSDSDTGTRDYSKTNIQVEGVDEPDFVKNDGEYIYLLNGRKLLLIDAYPADGMKIVGEIDFNESMNIRDIFVNGNKLIVFGNSYSYVPYIPEYSVTNDKIASSGMIAPCIGRGCGGYSEEKTIIYVYDISDKNRPELEKNISMKGNYIDSRMIGNFVYAISSQYIYGNRDIYPVLEIDGVEKAVPIGDVYYNDIDNEQFVFTNVFAMDIGGEDISNKVYLTGATGTIYVSNNNIYLTSVKRASYKDYNKRIVEEVILPLLPLEEKEKVIEIMKSSESDYGKFNSAMKIVKDYSNSLSGEDKNVFDQRLQRDLEAFKLRIGKESEKTIIHKIKFDKERINYEGVGEVPGRVLNQFSMDEFEGNFRIATTTGDIWSGNSLNHLFVLDNNMKNVGSVEDLAAGEKIYSVRFMSNRAYIVTFKKIDPFYVVDLSDSRNPRVLGYLKIPGYSDYLHPYDENHIIGVGKNARGGGENFAWYQGIKISLFDLSDVENPKEVAKFDIGDRGTDSNALYDHKAFLFDKEKKLLVLPILLAVVNQSKYNQPGWGGTPEDARYGDVIWQGAYVLNIDNDEISLRGKISHFNDSEKKYGPAKNEPIGAERKDWQGNIWVKQGEYVWKTNASGYENTGWGDIMIDQQPDGIYYQQNWYNDEYAIKRSLYMDNVLYTLSSGKIKASDLDTVSEIKSLDLPYEGYGGGIIMY